MAGISSEGSSFSKGMPKAPWQWILASTSELIKMAEALLRGPQSITPTPRKNRVGTLMTENTHCVYIIHFQNNLEAQMSLTSSYKR